MHLKLSEDANSSTSPLNGKHSYNSMLVTSSRVAPKLKPETAACGYPSSLRGIPLANRGDRSPLVAAPSPQILSRLASVAQRQQKPALLALDCFFLALWGALALVQKSSGYLGEVGAAMNDLAVCKSQANQRQR